MHMVRGPEENDTTTANHQGHDEGMPFSIERIKQDRSEMTQSPRAMPNAIVLRPVVVQECHFDIRNNLVSLRYPNAIIEKKNLEY
jgi:hypothetical protein